MIMPIQIGKLHNKFLEKYIECGTLKQLLSRNFSTYSKHKNGFLIQVNIKIQLFIEKNKLSALGYLLPNQFMQEAIFFRDVNGEMYDMS